MNDTPQSDAQQNGQVIFEYSLMQAIADGVLHPVGWAASGRPLIATTGTITDLPAAEIHELFDRFFVWQREVEPTLAEQDRMFVATANNGQTVWVIDDGATIAVLYPSEY